MRTRTRERHDFRREGSRTVRRARCGLATAWLEENAPWHVHDSSHYGLDFWRQRSEVIVTVSFGRYSAVLHLRRQR